MKRVIKLSAILIFLSAMTGCSSFIDVVPDNVATIDQAFRTKSSARRFLFSLYSYMPAHGDYQLDPSLTAGDELWLPTTAAINSDAWFIARGDQRVVDPYMNYWRGFHGGKDLYEGIRQTNIFLKNINSVHNMKKYEKRRWAAEARFLKAYYHFYLVRMYGPIVLVKKNKPVFSDPDEVNIPRSNVDSCFNYIEKLLNEAIQNLPEKITDKGANLGRITKGIALSIKAKVLVTEASPFFNGNKDYQGFKNKNGKKLFNMTFDPSKWDSAAAAAKKAVNFEESEGKKLYEYEQSDAEDNHLSDTTLTKMSIRNSVTKKWNTGIIWGNTNSMADRIQKLSTPRGLDPTKSGNLDVRGFLSPPLKIAEMFYTDHGLPIKKDKTWAYSQRFNVETATDSEKYNLKEGYKTTALNFNREPRYYADLGFDGGIWYGQGHYDDDGNLLFVASKKGQPAYKVNLKYYSVTGFYPKKLVNYHNVIHDINYTIIPYPWPVMRLADLYLLYAEALNESNGPSPEVFKYINLVRKRAGVPPVKKAWRNYSTNPSKVTTKKGMRQIIHRERLIELAFEGKRFWDLRRWKASIDKLNEPITGWDLDQEDASAYYRERTIFDQHFNTRDYLWPISEAELLGNKKLTQNPGWGR